MHKRYQVFVSSTYEDLKEERNKVIQALLNFDCIPCGMEYFPATDEDAWECIERLIPECDYYVVILAGMYGTIPPKRQKSFTHMEYELAMKCQVPVLGLLHRYPTKLSSGRCESVPARRKKLEKFRSQVGRKLCRYWENADQLSVELLASLRSQQNRRPRTGWVRADSIADDEAKSQIIKLQKKVEIQAATIAEFRDRDSREEEILASGDDSLVIQGEMTVWLGKGKEQERAQIAVNVHSTWNLMLKYIRKNLGITWRPDGLKKAIEAEVEHALRTMTRLSFVYSDEEIEKIHLQFTALGLITSRANDRWEFSARGLACVSKLLAIRKGQTAQEDVGVGKISWLTLSSVPDPETPESEIEVW